VKWWLTAWQKYAVFSGRSRRREYCWFVLGNIIVVVLLEVAIGLVTGLAGMPVSDATGFAQAVGGVFILASLIPSVAVTVRRLHDIGASGWWVFVSFVPLLNLGLLILYFADSQIGTNQYGPSPKELQSIAPA
jgi:uncharacterized membrane protein YhaH (DUF805 family)